MTNLDEPNLEDILQIGIAAAKRGDREAAQNLLQQVLSSDQKNDRAWLYMAYIEPNKDQRVRYLQTALRHNPNNSVARKALEGITKKRNRSQQRTLMIGLTMTFAALSLGAFLVLIGLLLSG